MWDDIKSEFIKNPIKTIWQVFLLVPVQLTRLLLCFMIAIFHLDYKMVFEVWRNTG